MKKYVKVLGIGTVVAASLPVSVAAQIAGQEQIVRYEVGTAEPPVEAGQTVVSMTLQEAIDRALESNLSLQSARLNPDIQRYTLQAARAAFTPTINANYGYTNSTNQSTSQLDGGNRTNSIRQNFNTSLSQRMPWYGGQLNASFNNSRNETDNAFSTRNPSYSSTVSLNYTQPILSGFRTDNQRATLRTQEIQGQITDLQLQAQITNLTNQVRTSYWALRTAIEQIEIQRLSLEQAQQLLDQNQQRLAQGQLAEIQIVQAEAQVASAEQSYLNAQIQWRNQELQFKTLLLRGADDPLLTQTVNPTELPTLVEQQVDIQAAVDRALQDRTDIRTEREQQRIAELNLEVTEQGSKPDLNLTASYSLQGVGGDLFERGELGGEPVLIQAGGYFDGLESIADFDTPTWSLGFNWSYPIGTNAGKANLERAELQLRQTEIALRSSELDVVTQVTNAGLTVGNTLLQVQAAQRAREAAERSTEAELLRFQLGVATNFEVLTSQDQLTSARLAELNAIMNHINAVAEFDRIQRVGG